LENAMMSGKAHFAPRSPAGEWYFTRQARKVVVGQLRLNPPAERHHLSDFAGGLRLESVTEFVGCRCAGDGYRYLFLVRMGVGGAESASSSGSQSLIASLFPVKERSSAMGVVFSGLAIGRGIAFAAGGAAAQPWGWRSVFLLAGIPGLLLTGFMWLLFKETPRIHAQDKEVGPAPPMWEVAAFFARNHPILFSCRRPHSRHHVLGIRVDLDHARSGAAARHATNEGWLDRLHASGLMKSISTAGSEFLADWLARGRIDRIWIVPTCALTLSFPVCVAMEMAPSAWFVTLLVMLLGMTMGTHYSAPKGVNRFGCPRTHARLGDRDRRISAQPRRRQFRPLLTGFSPISSRRQGIPRTRTGRHPQSESCGRALHAG
jgi:hypothetical protein